MVDNEAVFEERDELIQIISSCLMVMHLTAGKPLWILMLVEVALSHWSWYRLCMVLVMYGDDLNDPGSAATGLLYAKRFDVYETETMSFFSGLSEVKRTGVEEKTLWICRFFSFSFHVERGEGQTGGLTWWIIMHLDATDKFAFVLTAAKH